MTDAQYQTALSLYRQGRHVEGAQLLNEAAKLFHPPSMALLGYQMLTGRGVPLDRVAGVRLTLAAADRGEPAACVLAASLVTAGVFGEPDWPRGLDFLRQGAEAGVATAQAQLRLLSGCTGDDWLSLRQAIDIAVWRAAPEPRRLSQDARINAFEGIASPAVCDWIIGRARGRMAPAKVYDDDGGNTIDDARSNSAFELGLTDLDLVMLALRERLATAAGLSVVKMNAPQVLHYAVGQTFKPHVDFFDPAIPAQAMNIAQLGQRAATVLVYLNDEGLEGGETDFPGCTCVTAAAVAMLWCFSISMREGEPDRRTVHAGLAPSRGEKWLLSQWIRA